MKKYNFYQLFALLLVLLFFEACSKKNFPANSNTDSEAKYVSSTSYFPPLVISIHEEFSKINKDGEMYYDDDSGYRYWRLEDGKYHLDAKYLSGYLPNKKSTRKSAKKNDERQINGDREIKYTGE